MSYFTKKVSFKEYVSIVSGYEVAELSEGEVLELRENYLADMSEIDNTPTMHTPSEYIREWFKLEEDWADNFCLA